MSENLFRRLLVIVVPSVPGVLGVLQLIDFAGHALFGVHLGLGPL